MDFVTRPTLIYISSKQKLISSINKNLLHLFYLRFISWYVLLHYHQHRNANDSKDESPKNTETNQCRYVPLIHACPLETMALSSWQWLKKNSNKIFRFSARMIVTTSKNKDKCILWFSQWNSAFQKYIELWWDKRKNWYFKR